jgi:hypothetical protein
VVRRGVARLCRGDRRSYGARTCVSGACRDHRMAPARHPLRHRGRPGRRPVARRRTRRAADPDGCPGRRPRGHAAHRQASGDQRALVQRLGGDGRFRRNARPIAASLQSRRGTRPRRLPAFRQAGPNRAVRCHRWAGRRRPDGAADQLFAVSLPASPLDPVLQGAVVEQCGELLRCR